MKIKRLHEFSGYRIFDPCAFELEIRVSSMLSDKKIIVSGSEYYGIRVASGIVDLPNFNKMLFEIINPKIKRILGHPHYAITDFLFYEPIKTKRFGWIENEVELDWFPKLDGDL